MPLFSPTLLFPSDRIRANPLDILWHYAKGELPWNVSEDSDEVRWKAASHRGIQFMDKIVFPKSQRRYINTTKFEFRFDRRFDEVVHHCATVPRKSGRPWIGPELREGYSKLHRLGFAHSYEVYENDRLVAGAFGIHIGSYITCESMFHFVNRSGTFCWGQTLLHLRERGFAWIDTNCVARHDNQYGEEWVPHWKFEQMLRATLQEQRTVADDIPHPGLPPAIRLALPARRVLRAAGRRLKRLAWRPSAPASAPAHAATA